MSVFVLRNVFGIARVSVQECMPLLELASCGEQWLCLCRPDESRTTHSSETHQLGTI